MQQEYLVPQKSPNDQRQYQAIPLANHLKVLLVHDPKAEKAACAISVGVGSLMDGERSLGLAHFLEHMLFMGSRNIHNSSPFAYTSDEQTNYQMEVANAKFPQAVERICDFFVQALLTSTCIQKQRQAVHEECMLRCSEDNSRKWEILKHFASGPYHNHSIGNNSTLSHPDVEEDLRSFYKRQYSANRITATLLSAMPIQEMKEKLLPFFNEIQNMNLKKIQYQQHFKKENIGKMVQMQSIKDQVLMEFFWVIDSCRPYYKSHVDDYITHVIGHQGKNSLLSLLKAKDWVNQMTSYSHDLPLQTIVGLEAKLTQLGEQKYEQVYNFIIDFMSSIKPQKHIYEEISETAALSFKYKQKVQNFQYVTRLSSMMHIIPQSQILNWKSHYAEYDEKVFEKVLSQLVPENVVVVYSCSDQLENPQTEKHLGGKYIIKDLPKRKKIQEVFEPLMKNPFLPLKTDLIGSTVNVPIKQDNIWFVQGGFNVCKGGIFLKVCKPQSQIFIQFYTNYIDLLLKEITYEAQCLKLSVDFSAEDEFTLNIFGFSHAVQKLLEEIGPMIGSIHRSPQGQKLFKLAHQNLKEEYQNFYAEQLDDVADELLNIILKSTGTTIEDREKELKAYKYKKSCERIDSFWKTANLEWVVVGNFEKNSITNSLKSFQKSVGVESPGEKFKIQCLKLKKDDPIINITQLYSEDIGTSAVIKYKEIGQYDEVKFYTLSLLKNYIATPFFDKLRTQMQLAYYLAAYQRNIRGVLSLWFLLISSNTNPFDISNHIATFVDDFIAKIDEDLTEGKFQTLKQSIISKTMEPFHSLEDYFEFVCQQIKKATFSFDRKTNLEQLKGYLDKIKRQDVVNMLKQCLHYSLEIWVVAQPHQKDFLAKGEIKNTQSVQKIQKDHEYYKDRALSVQTTQKA